jgi:hypothetical protein
VEPVYEALNQPAKKDVAALLAKATKSAYQSYSSNEDWLNRAQLADVFKTIGTAVPDLRWTIKDLVVSGDQIVVRGEAADAATQGFCRQPRNADLCPQRYPRAPRAEVRSLGRWLQRGCDRPFEPPRIAIRTGIPHRQGKAPTRTRQCLCCAPKLGGGPFVCAASPRNLDATTIG